MADSDRDIDLALVLKSKKGDMDAFGELVGKYQSLVVNFCYRMLGSREDAEDIAQDTFLRAFKAIGRFEPKAKFSTWLVVIAKNLTLNLIRDGRKRERTLDTRSWFDDERDGASLVRSDGPGPDEALLRKERAQWVHHTLGELSDMHRSMIVLRDFEGLPYEEIAHVMGCREGTVKSRLSRARRELRKKLLESEVAAEHGSALI